MPLQIPPFLYVPDIRRILKWSGINDSEDLFLLIAMHRLKFRPCGESPLTVPTLRQCAASNSDLFKGWCVIEVSERSGINKALINIKRSRRQAVTALNIIVIANYPSPRTKLASPRKRGGGTAVEVFRLAVQYSDSPAFTILKLFRAVTVGIVNALEAFMIALLSISISYAPP